MNSGPPGDDRVGLYLGHVVFPWGDAPPRPFPGAFGDALPVAGPGASPGPPARALPKTSTGAPVRAGPRPSGRTPPHPDPRPSPGPSPQPSPRPSPVSSPRSSRNPSCRPPGVPQSGTTTGTHTPHISSRAGCPQQRGQPLCRKLGRLIGQNEFPADSLHAVGQRPAP